MADDKFYMRQALMEAEKAAERDEVPVGAVVVCRDRVIYSIFYAISANYIIICSFFFIFILYSK